MIADRLWEAVGKLLARFLSKQSGYYRPFAVSGSDALRSVLRPCDVLLVEGNQRFSTAVKYLTQSTWSHSALYVGDALQEAGLDGSEPHMLIEADLKQGVIAVPLSKYDTFNTRICRPVDLTEEDREAVIRFAMNRLGFQYDLKNVIDLMRYLIRTPPVPGRWRRRMLALGGGDPTRAICSTLIAQAFQEIRYPILPRISTAKKRAMDGYTIQEILHIRHHSLYVPRDFDLSPYFKVVKPTLESGFHYKDLVWNEAVEPPALSG
jgi:hypothetical protein